ncbi:MAG: VOC family protein [Candidatus Hinthialibacter antarcticus]|nr:VOC family protein [Candidatus Hinthialibacter antarcticus]
MQKLKLDHVAFPVSDLDASVAFYVEKLGLKLMFQQVDEEHGEAFAFLELEGGNLELLQSLKTPEAATPPAINDLFCPHVAIQVDDLSEWLSVLEEKEIAVAKGPLEIPGKVKWLYFADPDNNIIELVEWL